ncbi:alpha/beta hydrolase [Devosia sp. FKR38]|uniref:alpha/beta fold hydrolase n=1 Tax=Devosia sp. FKR38 TaxID=2562312 RepID=UPI0010C0CA4F|nr:alpha/beta hydrolase [Devosia sp. FKR38]
MDASLQRFAAEGAPALPGAATTGTLTHDGAELWYAQLGEGPAVILLHGGLGNAGNWGYQIPALAAAGYRVIALDTRGHGRSTSDNNPYHYSRLATDLLALMDHLALPDAALVGWSDGACTALELAMQQPDRVRSVFFFACNVTPDGALPFVMTPVIENCLVRHKADYAALSATPDAFDAFMDAVGLMQRSEPNYSAADLAAVRVPVIVAHSTGDEFIRAEHAAFLAASIPGATLVTLDGVTHFAPLQRPELFNVAVLGFLRQSARS